MTKFTLRLTAAMALAIIATSPAIAAKLRLPPPRAPEQQIYSPLAVAGDLQKRGYTIESIKRQGTAYSIKAVGPHKNKVQLMVDGRSGEIVGLAVLDAAANMVSAIAQAMKSGKNARYVDDLHPFGIIVPEVYQTGWIQITSWSAGPLYIDAAATGRGYRYAVPYSAVRPGRGGRSRSRIAPSRMQRPLYDVYEANGTELETVSVEDTTIISEVTTEETTYSEEYSAMEENYLGGNLGEASFDEVSDFDAEDGDLSFADDASDGYDADDSDADDAAEDVDDSADDFGDAGDDYEDAGDEAVEPDDSGDEADAADDADDGGDDYADEPDDDGDDYEDDSGEDDSGDYDDGGDEPEGAAGSFTR